MLRITEKAAGDFPVLQHGEDVFYKALGLVKEGEDHFHVTDPAGQCPDYDLVYIDNMMVFPEQVRALITKMTKGGSVYANFLDYDEKDMENLCLDFLRQFQKIEIEALDEYSAVLARVAVAHTDLPVFFTDERIRWFVDAPEQIIVVPKLPAVREKTTLRVTANPLEMGYTKRDFSYVSTIAAFQNVFFWQNFTQGKKGPLKYAEIVLSDITGIGGVLSHMSIASRSAGARGLTAYLRPGCTRYPESLLCRYFNITPKPEDAVWDNTAVIDDLAIFTTTWATCRFPANFDESSFTDQFAQEMREYADAVIGGRKVLGVLARGTDYVTNNLGGDRIHATVDQMIPVIRQWVEEDGYDKIFVATEDQDNFDKLRSAFPGMIIAISQERMRVSDLRKKNATLIYEFERKTNTGKEYEDALEDTTVNYFYALYILSRCDAFLCSGQCNGWDSVLSLNRGAFGRKRKLAVAIEGDPATDGWKEIRPVTAGMFARGAYPTNKAFYMTYRFDLFEKVDGDAVKKAWDQTLAVYPYMGYAVGTRNSRLTLLENPLPFVIEETGEVIEPFGRAGNFHTVTFCYLDNVLWIYADHVPVDGTGFRYVLETFFYYYYCALDGKTYPVPAGVHTEEEGAVPGQDIDAYRMVDAIDPTKLAAAFGGESSFVLKEAVRDELFATREDCRGYCISVQSAELMKYAKSVGGSPMSVMAVLFAKALERVHPENELPIKMVAPVSVRKVMGNENSLLHQVVHAPFSFIPEELKSLEDAVLNAKYRGFLKGFSSEQNIRMLCGVYRGICEGFEKAFAASTLDHIVLEQRASTGVSVSTSYVGTLRTGDYGSRIRMTAFHAMQEKGIMVQTTEVGGTFYFDWYQGFHGDMYAKAMRDLMQEAGMKDVRLERVE